MTRGRRVKINIATPSEPVWLERIETPMTPRAVREQMLRAPEWFTAEQARRWHDERLAALPGLLTSLDALLTDEEADCLERFLDCEALLAGNAPCGDYDGDRVQSSPHRRSPLPDASMARLKAHAAGKARLSAPSREAMLFFMAQMWGWDGAPSAAQAAMLLGLPGRNRRRAFEEAVKRAGAELAAMGY
jgi:hypothetical protein